MCVVVVVVRGVLPISLLTHSHLTRDSPNQAAYGILATWIMLKIIQQVQLPRTQN